MKLSRLFLLLMIGAAFLGWVTTVAHAQANTDALMVNGVSNNDAFRLVADLPDQSALAGMATGMAGLIALHMRRQRRVRAARRMDGDFTVTGSLRRLQPAFRVAPDRMGDAAFNAARVTLTPRLVAVRG